MTNQTPDDTLNAVSASEIVETLDDISQETQKRVVVLSRPTVVELEPREKSDHRILIPGSIAVVAFQDDHPELANAQKAAERRDIDELDDILHRVFVLTPRPTEELAPLEQVPHIADVRYASRSLTFTTVFIEPGFPAFLELFAFNGGRIDADAFTVTDHPVGSDTSALRTLVIISPPVLSDVEREALEHVPPDVSELHISEPTLLPFTFYRIYRFVRAWWRIRPWRKRWIVRGGDVDTDIVDARAAEEALRELPPMAAARELLRVRTEILVRRLASAAGPGDDTEQTS